MVSTIIPTAYRATVCIMCSAAVVVKPNFHTDTNATCDLSLVRPLKDYTIWTMVVMQS